ncbi:hypothetical protein P154DRAFT_77466 [Amniculicola lignicola CBS 123094]|uniref:Uncharacterized protein n=1 Tax=Amniculicola lignicola CBS 123094 TaxID=1392246 RepID=A0A6A5VWK3_9PLEO|nr:hypothetical protein P154DRAFT_77466 [Amniculicola lignicola CBS 123094]
MQWLEWLLYQPCGSDVRCHPDRCGKPPFTPCRVGCILYGSMACGDGVGSGGWPQAFVRSDRCPVTQHDLPQRCLGWHGRRASASTHLETVLALSHHVTICCPSPPQLLLCLPERGCCTASWCATVNLVQPLQGPITTTHDSSKTLSRLSRSRRWN